MSDKVFFDTNILVYSYSTTEPEKREIAQQLIIDSDSYISTQVLTELCNIVTKKLKFSYEIAQTVLDECCSNSNLITKTKEIIVKATKIASKYGYSFYDSLIISAALSANCKILYSEDMHHTQIIEKKLSIINPFA